MSEPAPRQIGEFLDELARAASLLSAYWHDPGKAMADFGLSDEQQRLLQSRNVDAIQQAIADERGLEKDDVVLYIHVCITRSGPEEAGN